MTRTILSGLAAAAMLMTAVSGPALGQVSGQGAPNMEHPFGVPLDFIIMKFLKDNDLAGATVAVTKRGRLVWSKGYGMADEAAGTQMQPWHRSRIGSVSKIFTALAAMKLVEEGKLDLERRVYGQGTPTWPPDLLAPPLGFSFNASGVLNDASAYFDKMIEGVNNLDPAFPPSASTNPSLLNVTVYRAVMNRTFEWASEMRVKHLLSHTSGMLRSGNLPGAANYHGKVEADLTYRELHLYMLTAGSGAPFEFEPGAQWKYSNHGFGLAGHIIDEVAGPGTTYRQFVEQKILHPLGLHNVVPNNTSISNLDAKPHGTDENGNPVSLDPNQPSTLGLATGGWSATARDLVRVMCSIDRINKSHRLLAPATVTTMESDPVPERKGRPIGWDRRSGGTLSKDGLIGGGTALIHKYLPGEISEHEINVAIAINEMGPVLTDLMDSIAKAAAQAYIPKEYDLFDPKDRCYELEPVPFQVTGVSLVGFYPVGTSEPLPPKIEAKCPVNIRVVGTFDHIEKGPVQYRFRFLVENKVSTSFTHVIKGDPEDPLYVPEQVTHTIPLPLPPAVKPGPKGGVPPGPGQLQVMDPPGDPLFPPQAKGPGKVAGPTVPGIKGTVRLEVLKPSGGVVSNPVHYHVECEPEMEILSGTVQLRDESKTAPGCPRPAAVAASIRTNKAGPVDYVLGCTGGGREWKGKTTAHQTAPNTFIGVAVHPIQIAKQEEVTCLLRKGEQFGFADVIATDKRLYPCRATGVAIPTPPPLPPGPPSGLKQPEPPAPQFVCLGGKVAGTAARPVCGCAAGEVARQLAANRFQCEAQLVCEGGRVVVRGRPPAPACECPSGLTAQEVARVLPASQPTRVPSAAAKKDDEPDRYRCVRVATLPGTQPAGKSAPGGPPSVACTGGVVRANRCVCPSGTSLQNGVCTSTAAKTKTPARSGR